MDGQVSIGSERLHQYLKVLLNSFQTNTELIEFVDNVCGGNVRLALDFVKVFIGSGHVDIKKSSRYKMLEVATEFHCMSFLGPLHMVITFGTTRLLPR